jgi:hypothetical protein
MITKLKKLTGDDIVLDKNQCNKVKAKGCICAWECDTTCGTKPGNDGTHYSSQKSFWEEPV